MRRVLLLSALTALVLLHACDGKKKKDPVDDGIQALSCGDTGASEMRGLESEDVDLSDGTAAISFYDDAWGVTFVLLTQQATTCDTLADDGWYVVLAFCGDEPGDFVLGSLDDEPDCASSPSSAWLWAETDDGEQDAEGGTVTIVSNDSCASGTFSADFGNELTLEGGFGGIACDAPPPEWDEDYDDYYGEDFSVGPAEADCVATLGALPATQQGELTGTDPTFAFGEVVLPYDAYCLTLAATTTVVIDTAAGAAGTELEDSMLLVTDSTGVALAFNDDDSDDDFYSQVEVELAAGTYVVTVLPYDDSYAGTYRLDVAAQ